MNIGDLFLRVIADDKGFEADLVKSTSKAGDKAGLTLGQRMSAGLRNSAKDLKGGLLAGIGLGGGLGILGLATTAVAGVTNVIFDSISAASDLNETMTKSEQIFGKNAKSISAWGDTAAVSFGQSKKAALDIASTFAGLFSTVGLTLDDATDKAKALTVLGTDLASFFNTDVATATQALRSGLAGESEPLRQFNVFLSETAVAAKAAELGMKKTNGQFTEGQKVTARYAIIMDQTGAAQGDFARTSDGLANSQRTLSAQVEDASAKFGALLLPIVTDLVHFVATEGVPALSNLIDVLSGVGKAAQDVADILNTLAGSNKEAADSADALGSKTTPLGAALHGVADAVTFLVNQELDLLDGGHRVADNLAAQEAAADAAAASMTGMAGNVGKAADDIVDKTTDVATAAANLKTKGSASFASLGGAMSLLKTNIFTNAIAIAVAVNTLTSKLVGEAQALIDGYYDPIIAADDLRVQKDTAATDQIAVNEARAALAKTKAGSVERKQAQLTLDQALATQHASQKALDSTRLNLLAAGKLSAKEQKAWLDDLKAKYKTATGQAKTDIGDLIAKIQELQRTSSPPITITVTGQKGGAKKRATGGPVTAGEWYQVNENTPNSEIWSPDISGTVSSGAVPASSSAKGGDTIYNIPVTVAAIPEVRDPLGIARTLGRFARSGSLEPK